MNETFIVDENRLFAPIRIGSIDGYAHIDTGARRSSILKSYSEQFPKIGVKQVHGVFASTSVSQVHLDNILFLGEAFHNIVADVQPDSQGGLDAMPFTVIMALGCDVLLQKPLYLNFEHNEIGYLESNLSEKSSSDLWLPVLKVSLGDHTFDAVFDTGGGLSVLNHALFTKLEKDMIKDEPIEVEDAIGTKRKIPTFKCDNLAIGERLLGECQFLVLDLSVIEQEANQRIDCVFGINAMVGKNWIIDSLKQQIKIV